MRRGDSDAIEAYSLSSIAIDDSESATVPLLWDREDEEDEEEDDDAVIRRDEDEGTDSHINSIR